MRVLVIDVGGTHVKVLATGHKKPVKIPSGPHMTAAKVVAAVRAATVTWIYHAVSIGSCFGRWQRRLLKKLLPGPRLRNANAFAGGIACGPRVTADLLMSDSSMKRK